MALDNSPERTRRDVLLDLIQKEFSGYHPLVSIARIAHNADADLKLQFECHRTIAKYVEPELKSLEVKGEINGRHRVSVSLFEPTGATFHPVEELAPAIEGEATLIEHASQPKQLRGGVSFDVSPQVAAAVADAAVTSGW